MIAAAQPDDLLALIEDLCNGTLDEARTLSLEEMLTRDSKRGNFT